MSDADRSTRAEPRSGLKIAIIGAGMSGILAGIKLKEAGFSDITIFEKSAQLGGTWRDNTYPGLNCDVPSHYYCYSFELNPNWTRLFAPSAEIKRYLEDTARKFGVLDLIRFEQEVMRAEYREGQWRLQTSAGGHLADVVIAATGVLHHPVIPEFAGREEFAGASFHSARWDHSVPLDGKRIGVIGSGSTAIQIVSALVPRVAKLSLFQRTAQWILPLPNPFYDETERQVFRNSHQRMREAYEFWAKRFQNTFARAVVGDKEQLGRLEALCKANLETVQDPRLRYQLTPDYQVACKRLIMSDEFYPAIQQPNAALVTSKIAQIEPCGVRTVDDKLHELDVLVYATGFDAQAYLRPMEVQGVNNTRLSQQWARGNQAYRSVALPDMPNFFLLIGPHSPIGNFSLIHIAELQLGYIMKLLERLRRGECRALAPSRRATEDFNIALKQAMKSTVWMSGCRSWYIDKNGIPGTWPWTFERFEQSMRQPDWADFDLQ